MNRNTLTQFLTMVLLAAFLALTGCGSDGSDGSNGSNGTNGTNGAPGAPGAAGGNVQIQNFHGAAFLDEELLVNDNKFIVDAKITSATADANGVVTVNFTVKKDGVLYPGATGFSFDIDKLVPAPPLSGNPTTDEISWNQWVPYIYRKETAGTHGAAPNDWPASQDGKKFNQASSESNGTLTDHGDGSYTYVFSTNLTTARKAVALDGVTEPGEAITYDRNLTHRISLMMGGHSGPTDDDTYDFVPATGVTDPLLMETRNIVATSGCKGCHGNEFHGHGGNRVSVENCVTCHNPSNTDAQSGNTLDMKVMIHKIHMGGELPSVTGPATDGILWDDPTTPADETADNATYAIWGYQTTKHTWWKVGFPALIQNCTKCHQGGGKDETNWKTKLSRAACGSCHDNVNFATGAGHGPANIGGVQKNDNFCSTCHQNAGGPTGTGLAPDPVNAHHWTTTYSGDPLYDARNIPEFTATITFENLPGSGYYSAGDAPLVSVSLKDPVTLADMPMGSADFFQSAATGCNPTGCPANTAGYAASNFFVQGPRGHRVPVLTTAARAQVQSTSTGPFVLAAGNTLVVWVDQGIDVVSTDLGGTTKAGKITVTVPADGPSSPFTGGAANATPTQIKTWLNANATFAARAIAAVEASGKLSIRSRNLGLVYGIQLQTSAVTTAVFGGDVAIHMPTGSTASNKLAYNTSTSAYDDPKVSWVGATPTKIFYQLDPVDDLTAGTYVVNVEIGDRGRLTADVYKTPSVAKKTFQVKTATEELAPAGNCDTCHQSQSEGMVFDQGRHHKIFDDTAVDQCGACHDYMPQTALGTSLFDWPGAIPISRRVHGVHFGSSLNYPLLTIRHADEPANRLWDITFPQDVRNCDTTCHQNTAGPGTNKTSGSWATKPARTPCMGCHDSDYASAHMTLMTYDPTPAAPWSGDEKESCKTCH